MCGVVCEYSRFLFILIVQCKSKLDKVYIQHMHRKCYMNGNIIIYNVSSILLNMSLVE